MPKNKVRKVIFVASLIIVIQMLALGLPAIFLGKYLYGIKGIFIGIAFTYALGGVLSMIVNKQIMDRFKG